MTPMMNARARFWLLALLATSVWAAMMLFGGAGSSLDITVSRALYANEGALGRNALLLTRFGGWAVLTTITLGAALLLVFTRKIRAALLLFTVFGGRLLVELQKLAIDRDRPGVSPHLEAVNSMSFPSGHSANAMITYLTIALLVPVGQRNRAIAVGIALAAAIQVGWSRLALGVHWASDVVGGWAFGILWVAICLRLASARPEAEPSIVTP